MNEYIRIETQQGEVILMTSDIQSIEALIPDPSLIGADTIIRHTLYSKERGNFRITKESYDDIYRILIPPVMVKNSTPLPL